LGGFWADRPGRKNRPGAFTNSEKVELVEFGTQCIFPFIPLSFWERSGTPGRMYLLGKDISNFIISSPISVPTIGLLLDFLFKFISSNHLICRGGR